MPFSHAWLPYIYLYVVGGLLFTVGLVIIIKSGSLDLKRPNHRIWLRILIFGIVWFMVMHGLWNLAALEIISLKVGLLLWCLFMILSVVFAYFTFRRKASS